ncbi:hypothetical protein J3F84DRAFT_356210 [Trichoderma pleuroticola]
MLAINVSAGFFSYMLRKLSLLCGAAAASGLGKMAKLSLSQANKGGPGGGGGMCGIVFAAKKKCNVHLSATRAAMKRGPAAVSPVENSRLTCFPLAQQKSYAAE